MKWIEMIFPVLTSLMQSFSKSPKSEPVDYLRTAGRSIFAMIVGSVSVAILFSAGLILTLVECANQLDVSGSIHFSSKAVAGFGLILISAIIFGGVFYFTRALDRSSERPKKDASGGFSIGHAISAYIFDLIKERETRRQNKDNDVSHYSSQSGSNRGSSEVRYN